MDLQLRGKRALVTGSTAGIGLAAAAGLYREGASIVVNGRTRERVQEAVAKIQGQGGDGEVSGISADLSPVGGPILGPFDHRSKALEAEVAWLEANWLFPSG